MRSVLEDISPTPNKPADTLKLVNPQRPVHPARPARHRPRHILLILLFLIWVVAPVAIAGWYLFTVAEKQYASTVGFTVRKEETGSALEILGGITELSGSNSADTDILYEFIQSQEMVRKVHRRLDLAVIYNNPDDPFFGLGDDLRIEALTKYWKRMVKVYYDTASGLIEIRVLAFDPQSAQDIVTAIYDESSQMINQLSAIAQSDVTRYAKEELSLAVERLKQARQARVAFQNRTGIVDPSADFAGRMGLLNTLQAQLAETKIKRELLLLNSQNENDPRMLQIERKLMSIRKLINEERSRFVEIDASSGNRADAAYSDLLSRFEALEVDLQFAEKSYLSAQAAYDIALAEAQRKSRYLASYIAPTKAETAEYPRRFTLLLTLAALLLISWAIVAMVYYSVRDRR